MQRSDIEVRAAAGCRLLVDVAGPEHGDVVLFHSGTPGSRLLYEPNVAAGAKRGLRHVCYSRPGYEGSDRRPGRTITDGPAYTAAVLDALGVNGSVYVIGQSGGGQYALADAALLRGRVRAVATMSCLAPSGAEGLDWFAGMAKENVKEFRATDEGDLALQRFIEPVARRFFLATEGGEQLQDEYGELLSDVDRAFGTDEYAEYEATCWRRMLAGGIWGWADDDKASRTDWGFDLDRIDVPVTVWQGGKDRMVPPAHGEWLARHLTNSRLRLLPDEGHGSLTKHYGAVLDELVAAGA